MQAKQTQPAPAAPDPAKLSAPPSSWRLEGPWLAIVAAGTLVVAVPRYLMQLAYGPGWDPYTFLLNALEYAGQGKSYLEVYRPPLLPFLVSLFNRVGVDAPWPLFFVDALVTCIGVMGLYLLLREGLSRPVAALGALAFLSFPDVIENLSAGLTDLMSVAVSIWIVYFILVGLRRDTRYLRWAVVLIPVAFMTRFTGGMMLAVLVLALIYDGGRRHVVRDIVAGVAYSAVLLVPYFAYHWWRFGDPLIQLWEPFRAVTATERVGMLAGQIEASTYFLVRTPSLLSDTWLGWGLLLLLLLGLTLAVQMVAERRARPVGPVKIVVLAVAGAALSVLVVGTTSFIIVLIGWMLLLGVLVRHWVADRDDDRVRFLVVMLFWLVLYLSIHSHMLVKVTRYYLTMLPALVLFIVLPLEVLRERLAGQRLSARAAFPIACAALATLVAFSTYASFRRLDTLPLGDSKGYEAARQWFDANVPQDARVASDIYPAMRYRLRRMMYPSPPFALDRPAVAEHWLDTNAIDYFVTVHDYAPLAGMPVAFRSGAVVVHKRVSAVPDRPDILLIGSAVDRQLNEVLGPYGPYLHSYLNPRPDDFSSTAGTFIDEFTPAELARYDAVMLFWFRWHDRLAAERVLKKYVSDGGTVLIDASENLGGLPEHPWGLQDTTFLDVLVTRGSIPATGTTSVNGSDLLSDGAPPQLGSFVSEEGGPWYGAVYDTRFTTGTRPLVTYAGVPLVIEQRIGRGRVLWLAGNLSFHAFLRGASSEQRFIAQILEYADGAGSIAVSSTPPLKGP